MTIKEEISAVLEAAGLQPHYVVCKGVVTILCPRARSGKPLRIFPVQVFPTDVTPGDFVYDDVIIAGLENARERQKRYADAVGETLRIDGEYPLVITEDRWRRQRDMMKTRLLAHMELFTQVYARNCTVKRIDKPAAAAFLEANHTYGDAVCRHRYGLYVRRQTGEHRNGDTAVPAVGELVAVATFSNARKWVKGGQIVRSYEWTRYASLPGVRVTGGMGKLLKAFVDDVHPDDIMSYADLEWSGGNVYERLGFSLEEHKAPVSFIIDPVSWQRRPASASDADGQFFFLNFGSGKYRLKLTGYDR